MQKKSRHVYQILRIGLEFVTIGKFLLYTDNLNIHNFITSKDLFDLHFKIMKQMRFVYFMSAIDKILIL